MLYYVRTAKQAERSSPLALIKNSVDTIDYPLDTRYDELHSIIYNRNLIEDNNEIVKIVVNGEKVDDMLVAYLMVADEGIEQYLIYDAKFLLDSLLVAQLH